MSQVTLSEEAVQDMILSFERTKMLVTDWINKQEKIIDDGGTPYEKSLLNQMMQASDKGKSK